MSDVVQSEAVRAKTVRVTLGTQGRLVIPAELRCSLGLHEGDQLIIREDSGNLVVEKVDAIHRCLRAMFAHIPKEHSLADELIAERREAAKKELEE